MSKSLQTQLRNKISEMKFVSINNAQPNLSAYAHSLVNSIFSKLNSFKLLGLKETTELEIIDGIAYNSFEVSFEHPELYAPIPFFLRIPSIHHPHEISFIFEGLIKTRGSRYTKWFSYVFEISGLFNYTDVLFEVVERSGSNDLNLEGAVLSVPLKSFPSRTLVMQFLEIGIADIPQ